MVVNIQVGVWQGYKLDKVTTHKVTTEASAAPDAARVNKHLIPKEALKDIMIASSAARAHFYDNTLPWKDNGDRLLTRATATKFIEDHAELARRFHTAVDEFLDGPRYATAIDQAEFRMGDMFNAADYPTTTELRRKFYIHLDIDGIAAAKDIRLRDDETIIQARVTKAMEGLWAKLAAPLKHFGETMANEDAVFRNATVNNLKAVVAAIPDLNFNDDQRLEFLRNEIEAQLLVWEPDDLRKNKEARAQVSEAAQDIITKMSGWMSAFGVQEED